MALFGIAPAFARQPTDLPPLLPVPPATGPTPLAPRGPAGEFDPGYFYLPERAPEPASPAECGPAGRFWLAPGLELAWSKPAQVPSLVRAGNSGGPIVYGNEALIAPFRAGFSLTGGVWLEATHTHGFDGSFFTLAEGGNNTVILADRTALLLPTANGGAFPLADPNLGYVGAYQAGLNSRFSSADVNYRNNLLCSPNARLDALVGYRYGHLGEDFGLYGKRLGPGGEIVRFRDDVSATNQFHGGQIGLAGECRLDKWYVAATGKIAFGAVFTHTDLEGKFRVNGTVAPIGFYARPGANGEMQHTAYGVMPAVGVSLGRQLGEHSRVFVGYNFLYMNNLIRGPDVIDPTPMVLASNPQSPQLATTVRRDATTSDFWAQSLSLGMEWRY